MAKRAGVRRISKQIYNPVRMVITSFLESIVRNSVIYTEYGNRKTVTVKEVGKVQKTYGDQSIKREEIVEILPNLHDEISYNEDVVQLKKKLFIKVYWTILF